jgi:hypothetical protein
VEILQWQAAELTAPITHGAIAQHVGKPQRLQRAPVMTPRDFRLGERDLVIDPSAQPLAATDLPKLAR